MLLEAHRWFVGPFGAKKPEILVYAQCARAKHLEQRQENEVLRVLASANVPISVIAELCTDDALLASPPERVAETLSVIQDVWPNSRALQSTIRNHPFVLSDEAWLARLPTSTADLAAVGFTGAQAAKMIVDRPDIVYLRRFEVNNTIKALSRAMGTGGGDHATAVLTFFANNPSVLLDFRELFTAKRDAVASVLSLERDEATRVLVQHGAIFKADTGVMKAAMDVLVGFLGDSMAREVVLAAPQVLTMTVARVKESVRVLRSLEVEPADVVTYPQAIVRHPLRVVGPRIQFMTGQRGVRLASYLSLSERTFLDRYVKGNLEAWERISQDWNRLKASVGAEESNVRTPPPASDEPTDKQIAKAPVPQLRKPNPRFKKRLTRLPRLGPRS